MEVTKLIAVLASLVTATAADLPETKVVGDGPGKITLTWRAPESGPEVAGYYIYAVRDGGMPVPTGEAVVGDPFVKVDVGNRLSVRLEGLAYGRWSFAATAFNPYGLESDPSNVFTRAWLRAPTDLEEGEE